MRITAKCTQKQDLAARFNTTKKVISKIKNRDKGQVLVASFTKPNQSDNYSAANAIIEENPSYTASGWNQSGPCSNWGVDVFRPETEQEYESRMRKAIKKYEDAN